MTKQNKQQRPRRRPKLQPPRQMKRAALTRGAKKALSRTRRRVVSQVGVNTKQFQMLMNTLTLPHDTAPVRYPLIGAAKRTVTKKLYAEYSLICQETDYSTWPMILARSPVHPVWIMQQALNAQLMHQYALQVQADGTDPKMTMYQAKFGNNGVMPGILDTFHASACCRYLVYVPAGAIVKTQVGNCNSAGHEVKLTFACLRSLSGSIKETSLSVTIPLSSGGGIYDSTQTFGTWLKLDRFVTADNQGNAINTTFGSELVITIESGVPTHYLLPAFKPIAQLATTTLMGETRINASSLLVTNVTPNLLRGGRVDAAYVDYEQSNVFDTNSLSDNLLTRQEDLRYMGPGEKGLYMFTMPSDKSQQLTSYFLNDNIQVDDTGPWVPPGVLAVLLEDFQFPTAALYQFAGLGGNDNQTFACFYDQHLEAVSTEQVWDPETADPWLTPDLYQKMLTALANLPPACENPGHWDKLKNFVKKAFLFARPEIASLAGRMAGMLL